MVASAHAKIWSSIGRKKNKTGLSMIPAKAHLIGSVIRAAVSKLALIDKSINYAYSCQTIELALTTVSKGYNGITLSKR